MRFWFEHSSEVSLREQIVTQVTLGVLTGELAAGERLPSIRELARRFDLHANTVSAGYRQLEADGWVVSRKGSGVYVQKSAPASAAESPLLLDRLIANLFDGARRLNIPAAKIVARVSAYTQRRPIAKILLVEPDAELRRIVLAELTEILGPTLPLEGCDFGECAERFSGALALSLPSKLERVTAEAAGTRVHCLRIRSIPTALAEHLPAPNARAGNLVGIASRWPDFLRFARTMLVAAGFPADALILRDAREPRWRDGLTHADAIVCDLVTAQRLPGLPTIVTRILADDTAIQLQALIPR